MDFEWDARKNTINLKKHGIRFEEAAFIFIHKRLSWQDKRKDYKERRTISIGEIAQNIVLVVAYTKRDGRIRIISARKANKRERGRYYEVISKETG